jgi:hypothetical protein
MTPPALKNCLGAPKIVRESRSLDAKSDWWR